ncbi:MAG: PIN domain-containing protein [Oceanipulchritudo sp.]
MRADSFIDTNILVYSVDGSEANAGKKHAGMELLRSEDFGLSAQVMQEFYVTVTRKIEQPLTPDEALAYLDRFSVFPVVLTDTGLVAEAIRNSVKYQLSYWDGAILAAADRLGATTLYSEDFNHGQKYGDVRVVNPFEDGERIG